MESNSAQRMADAYSRLQQVFGQPVPPVLSDGGLRLRFPKVDLGAETLAQRIAGAHAQIELAIEIPAPGSSGSEDLVTGRSEGLPFMATGRHGEQGYAVDLWIYGDDKRQHKHVGHNAVHQMVDALFEHAPMPPDALSSYLSHRLVKLPKKEARRLAAEVLQVVTDYMSAANS